MLATYGDFAKLDPNVVSQLHIHHVARFASDAVWPRPVWGAAPAVGYQEDRLAEVVELINQSLAMDSGLVVDWGDTRDRI